MADLRTARRAPPRASRASCSAVRRAEAAEAIAAAAERAREIVRAAEAEAAAVVDRARQEATEADTGYATAWRAATAAGWAPAQLRGMGYPRPATPRRRAGGPVPAEPVPGAEHSPAAAAAG